MLESMGVLGVGVSSEVSEKEELKSLEKSGPRNGREHGTSPSEGVLGRRSESLWKRVDLGTVSSMGVLRAKVSSEGGAA